MLLTIYKKPKVRYISASQNTILESTTNRSCLPLELLLSQAQEALRFPSLATVPW